MTKINRYQIVDIYKNQNNAGSKAPNDIINIAQKDHFKKVEIYKDDSKGLFFSIKRQFSFFKQWVKAFKCITKDSIVLIQTPIYFHDLSRFCILKNLKRIKHVKFIYIVHDVEELRGNYSKYQKFQFSEMLKLADRIIVHNEKMRGFFIHKGVAPKKIFNLQIFDYLITNYQYDAPVFSKKVIIAGNLDSKKTEYLAHLNQINAEFELYGPNFTLNDSPKITYKGVVKPEELTKKLKSGLGLIWDGPSIQKCVGDYGKYLQYNNPHKLSLYLASGLPVIIWKEAAEADFVLKNNIGFVVDSLEDIPDILDNLTPSMYIEKARNVQEIAKKLTIGFYTDSALNKVISSMMD